MNNIPQKPIDWRAYDQWTGTDKAFAESIDMDPNNFAQYKRRHRRDPQPTIVDVPVDTIDLTTISHSAEDTALRSADDSAALSRVPDIHPTTVQTSAPDSAEIFADHETRLQMLEGFMAALQAQARQPSVQQITVQSRIDSAYALHSAESVQSWDDPEDAKPERWNLWLPRGLKRRIEAQAKAAGIAPSSLVQRLLMAAVNGGRAGDA